MKQSPQHNRLSSAGVKYVNHKDQSFLDRNPQHHEDQTPQRSIQPIKLDTYEKPPRAKKSKYQRE